MHGTHGPPHLLTGAHHTLTAWSPFAGGGVHHFTVTSFSSSSSSLSSSFSSSSYSSSSSSYSSSSSSSSSSTSSLTCISSKLSSKGFISHWICSSDPPSACGCWLHQTAQLLGEVLCECCIVLYPQVLLTTPPLLLIQQLLQVFLLLCQLLVLLCREGQPLSFPPPLPSQLYPSPCWLPSSSPGPLLLRPLSPT